VHRIKILAARWASGWSAEAAAEMNGKKRAVSGAPCKLRIVNC
jgi:hypothetical protein